MNKILIQDAIDEAGGIKQVSQAINRSYEAVRKIYNNGKLPRTEFSGETEYAKTIAPMTDGKYSAEYILQHHNQPLCEL